jgi:hypothetical protein
MHFMVGPRCVRVAKGSGRWAAVFVAILAVTTSGTARGKDFGNTTSSREGRLREYVERVLERASQRHAESLARWMPDGQSTPEFRRHWSAWREGLHRDTEKMGCGQVLLWLAFSQYVVGATWATFEVPYGALAWLLLPPASWLVTKTGLPRVIPASTSTASLRAFAGDVETVRKEMRLVDFVGSEGEPWEAEAFAEFRALVLERFERERQELEDSLTHQREAGFPASPDRIERWTLDYFALWDLATLYELESRRYGRSRLGCADEARERELRERVGLAVDEIRTAIYIAAGGSYRRDR